mmetsp:Transcript_10249/g.15517  ORF Transcript_10249/g.15517 Transcript_10249/m.15517 type:complete len:217 (-) Transcript_10249:45-695(-)|eukprot:CAMPEP_0202693722 /NCGR_PEP_ID=MMETSP1385-20130828/7764_1 /ASSEMBLY_ACC=CAM_ASM_000861 /TAXON_ID=933848 /ORGANISM="Elphidium margaritaceum" /LENGTH=216 /DNA_ID=CAMNT_0049349443 /DNA_START=100 /DNA_END=753 /DNA_ORIENTATION=-
MTHLSNEHNDIQLHPRKKNRHYQYLVDSDDDDAHEQDSLDTNQLFSIDMIVLNKRTVSKLDYELLKRKLYPHVLPAILRQGHCAQRQRKKKVTLSNVKLRSRYSVRVIRDIYVDLEQTEEEKKAIPAKNLTHHFSINLSQLNLADDDDRQLIDTYKETVRHIIQHDIKQSYETGAVIKRDKEYVQRRLDGSGKSPCVNEYIKRLHCKFRKSDNNKR